MKTLISSVFIILGLIATIFWIVALFKPSSSVFKKLSPKFKGRKGLTKILLPISLVLLGVGGALAPPPVATISYINLTEDKEVIEETFTIEGNVSGTQPSLKINNENIEVVDGKFSKKFDLKPGDNKFDILLTGKNEKDEVVTSYQESRNIYFDYEGMLYAQEQERDAKEKRELEEKLARVPAYEVVRKQDIDKGFSAVLYVAEDEDYLLANAVRKVREENAGIENITLLIFNQRDKGVVESYLEGEDLSQTVPYVRANYEKNGSNNKLFWFPEGAEGRKVEIEI